MGRKIFKVVEKELNQTQKKFYFMSLANFYKPPLQKGNVFHSFNFHCLKGGLTRCAL